MSNLMHSSFLLLVLFRCTSGASILMPWTTRFTSPSMTRGLAVIGKILQENGHNVTLLVDSGKGTDWFPEGSYSQALIFKDKTKSELAAFNDETISMIQNNVNDLASIRKFIGRVFELRDTLLEGCNNFFKDTEVMNILQKSEFDLVVIVPWSPCDVLIPYVTDTPFVSVFFSIRFPIQSEGSIGMPYPSAYVPFSVFGFLTDDMSFFQRIQNLFDIGINFLVREFFTTPFEEIKSAQGIAPDRRLVDLYSDTLVWFTHTGVATDWARPFTPNFVPIGGLMAQPSKPLSKDLLEFVEGAGDHGIIVFSVGSIVKGMNEKIADIFAKVFAQLPQRVLWKHDGKTPLGLGDNTRIMKWIPQNDILAYPNTRLFIYHGGSNGVWEGIYHAVPMIIMPIGGDQSTHAARIQGKGIGRRIRMSDITEDYLLEVIQEVLNNPKYKANMDHISAVHHNLPMSPRERIVYWIEHVIKFGGAHLRPRAADMSTIELYMIDVMAFFGVILLAILYVDYLLIKWCFCRTTRGENKRKTE